MVTAADAVGYDTTVMARSILLRGFDQQCAEMIGEIMKKYVKRIGAREKKRVSEHVCDV